MNTAHDRPSIRRRPRVERGRRALRRIAGRRVNGALQRFGYDKKGQLAEVTDENGRTLEKYEYDPAGNILAKTVGGETTRYEYDAANQLVRSTDAKGKTTEYAYDAAGRMVREGEKEYRYGYLDKVMSIADGEDRYSYTYHVDGQVATATYTVGGAKAPVTEDFLWDGLALIRRGRKDFINEPHAGGGNPVLASNGTAFFNDALGTTLAATREGRTAESALTAFGANGAAAGAEAVNAQVYFTGKPEIPGLGRAFLMRNYRADLGKWQTADPIGYPDGWNQMAYCGNAAAGAVDLWGCYRNVDVTSDTRDFWQNISGAILSRGNIGEIDRVNQRTLDEARNCSNPVVQCSLGSWPCYVWSDWKRTGKTRSTHGYTEYEVTRTRYCYDYEVTLLLQLVDYGSDYWLSLIGTTAIGFLGGFLTGGAAWAAIGAGTAATSAAYWLDGQEAYIPIGLLHTLEDKREQWSETTWVE